ncbi:MAG: hypothetical protein AAF658_15600 [Myxococcota bacterium]
MIRYFPIVACALLIASGANAGPVEPFGEAGKLVIEGDDLGTYHIVPRRTEMRYEVEGPGVLFLYFVNHRTDRKKAATKLAVSLDAKRWKSLRVSCPTSDARFKDQKKLRPCARQTRELVVPEGEHIVGLQLTKTKFAASAYAIFTPTQASTPPPAGDTKADTVAEPEPPPELEPIAPVNRAQVAANAPEVGGALDGAETETALPPEPSPSGEEEPELMADSDARTVESSEEPELVLVPLVDEPDIVATEPSVTVEVEDSSAVERLLEPLPLILLGSAVVLGGASIYFGLEMDSDFDEAEDLSTPQVRVPELQDSAKDNRLIAWSLAGTAIAAAGSAVIIALTSRPDEESASENELAPNVSAGCSQFGCGALMEWRFP